LRAVSYSPKIVLNAASELFKLFKTYLGSFSYTHSLMHRRYN